MLFITLRILIQSVPLTDSHQSKHFPGLMAALRRQAESIVVINNSIIQKRKGKKNTIQTPIPARAIAEPSLLQEQG